MEPYYKKKLYIGKEIARHWSFVQVPTSFGISLLRFQGSTHLSQHCWTLIRLTLRNCQNIQARSGSYRTGECARLREGRITCVMSCFSKILQETWWNGGRRNDALLFDKYSVYADFFFLFVFQSCGLYISHYKFIQPASICLHFAFICVAFIQWITSKVSELVLTFWDS